jgi:hypothetical protein
VRMPLLEFERIVSQYPTRKAAVDFSSESGRPF